MTWAAGTKALGECDRCGLTYLLNDLKEETHGGVPQNNRVCHSCWDEDNPQLRLGEIRYIDYQALRDARPDQGEEASTSSARWNPVLSTVMILRAGTVIVSG